MKDCRQGKIAYVTRAEAHHAVREMARRNKRSRTKRRPCHVYQCQDCRQFNIGREFEGGKK